MLFSYAPINSAILRSHLYMYVQSTFQLVVNEINVRKMEKWLTDGMFAWTTDLSILLVLVSACMPREARVDTPVLTGRGKPVFWPIFNNRKPGF